MWFGLIFDTLLQFEHSRFPVIFMKVNGQWVPCVHNSSYSFIPILLKLYRCLDHALNVVACGLNLILRLIFDTFYNLNFVIFRALRKCIWFGCLCTLFSDYILNTKSNFTLFHS